MSENPRHTINAVIHEIGIRAPLTNADWGREFATALMDTGDEEAIYIALSDAGEMYRSSADSAIRSRARKAVKKAIEQGTAKAATAATHTQLEFPVCAEGMAPRPLIKVTNADLKEALAYALKKLGGMEQNVAFLRQAVRLTDPFPGMTVEYLIHHGQLQSDDFVMEQAS